MSKVDAERALLIYKTFSRQTDEVVTFLSVARQHEHATRLEIPKLKHAPTSLTGSLEEYLHDADFEVNRRQYLAQQEAKKGGKSKGIPKDPSTEFGQLSLGNRSAANQKMQDTKPQQMAAPKIEQKGPAPDLIDFFESIEQNQQPMMSSPQAQVTNPQAMPQYQFPPQALQTQLGQQQQQGGPSSNSTNPFASMVSSQQPQNPQQVQNIGQQPFSPFTMQQQGQPAQPFGTINSSTLGQDLSGNFALQQQQQGQQQQQPFAGAQNQQPFVAGHQAQQHFANAPQQLNTGTQLQTFNSGQQQQQPSTNPFRQSMMPQPSATPPQNFSNPPPLPFQPQNQNQNQQSTNPFARDVGNQSMAQNHGTTPFSPAAPLSTASFFSTQSLQSPQSFHSAAPAQPLQPSRTGTNPFARSAPSSNFQTPTTSPLMPQATGTNPFRQSVFVNQQTGQGWQSSQGTMGGLEKMETVPIFPRPAPQMQPQSQQPWP